MTQVEASKASGIPQSTISTSERESGGSSDTAVYAKLYGVSAHWLATGEGDMLPAKWGSGTLETTEPAARAELGTTLSNLGEALMRASPQTRAAVADLLGRYAQDPASSQSLLPAIQMLIEADRGTGKQEPSA